MDTTTYDVPDGMVVYHLMSRTADPEVPVMFTFRGTDDLFSFYLDVQLNGASPSKVVPDYELRLQEYYTYISWYLREVDDIVTWRLSGHSLGGKFAADVLLMLLNADELNIRQ